MAWIESHQALGHHPKTLRLATELKCRVPEAVGYLHFFWWWALDYAPDGVVQQRARAHVAQACLWRGKPETFWSALMLAGFVDVDGEHTTIHDWMDYAGRLVEKRALNAARSKRARDAHRVGLPTNQPTGEGVKPSPLPTNPQTPLHDSPPAHGSAGADGAPPRAADESLAVIHAEAGICPFCRLPYTGSYLDHTAAKHRVHSQAEPGNLHFSRRFGSTPDAPPPEFEAQMAAGHERIQHLEHDNA